MNNSARKRSTLVVIVIVIAILSTAAFVQFGGKTSPPVGSTSTSTTLSSSTTSSTQQKSTSTSSSGEMAPLFIGFSQDFDSLRATPSVTLNYTVTITQFDATARHVTFSAASTVPGVTLAINPGEFTFLGTQEAVVLGISVASTVNSSILPVEIKASTAAGTTNSTFDFRLNKALIVILPNSGSTPLTPSTLHVSVGQTVTWLDLVEADDDGNGAAIIKLLDGSAASPTMDLNGVWSLTFDKPGMYPYQVSEYGYGNPSGLVVVS